MAQAHAERPIWTEEGAEKRRAIQRMFDDIAPNYDRVNGLMSLQGHHRWRAAAVRALELRPGDRALDLCCGTGDFLVPLRAAVGPDGVLLGLDFSLNMLRQARAKLSETLAQGDACRLPLRDQSVDAVSVGWGIRNVADIDAAHREIYRVLRPGGRFVSVDMARARTPILRWGSDLICKHGLPLLGLLFGQREAYTYLPKSTERFLSREALAASMERAGFTGVRTQDFLFGNICMHWGQRA